MPPVEHAPRQFHALAREILQRIGVGRPGAGGRLASAGQSHAAVEHVAQLLGRADVEAFARQFVDLRLDGRRRRGELVREPLQHVRIDDDAGHFHARQHRHQRPLQRLVDGALAHGRQPRLEQQPEPQRHVGIFRRIVGGAAQLHAVEADRRLARARHLLEADRLVAQMAIGEFVHAMADIARLQRIGDQHSVVDGCHRDAVPREHLDVVFQVLPDLQDGGILEQRLEAGECCLDLDLSRHRIAAEEPAARGLVAQRDVAGLAGCSGQRHAHQIGLHRIQRIGLGVDGEIALAARLRDPAFERCQIGDRLVGLVTKGHGLEHIVAGRWHRSLGLDGAARRSRQRFRLSVFRG